MIDSSTIAHALSTFGVILLFPLAVIEGPIVTVVGAYLASQGLLNLGPVIVCVILADVAGDCLLYAVGSKFLPYIPHSIHLRLGLTSRRLEHVTQRFQKSGVKYLVAGKLTHAAGFAVLIGAGISKMRFSTFVLTNFLATIPKSLAFVALGYLLGGAHTLISQWISGVSEALFAVTCGGFLIYYLRQRNACP